jgi:signal transduction histidine kinase
MGDLPVLRAEPIVLGQVLSTLLHQAAEFAIQGKDGKAEVRVNARTERVMGEISIHFVVSDNGPEQDPNDLSMLFGRGYSETNRKSVFSGFHWCSNVVSAMKGSLDIKSGPDGTDFHLILPVGGDA